MSKEKVLPQIVFDHRRVDPAPQAIAEFVRRALKERGLQTDEEKRRQKRFDLGVPVLIMPVDEKYMPAGETFEAVGRDISTGGICLISSRSVQNEFLAVELIMPNEACLRVIVRVLRGRSTGRFYEIAGKFVAKIAGPDEE